jgi:hypothetical protein
MGSSDLITVRELGSLYKEDHPEYAHIPDAEIGRELIVKYPEYANSVDLEDNDLEALIKEVSEKAKRVRGGWFSSWFGKKNTIRRREWYEELLRESQTIRNLALEEDRVNEAQYQRSQRPLVREQLEKERDTGHRSKVEINKYVEKLAKDGFTLETDQQIKVKEAESRIKIQETERIHRLEEEHRKVLDGQEVEKTHLLKMDELRRVFILKHFTDHQKLSMIQTALDDNYRDIARLERDKVDGWEYMVADRKENIATLKENQNALRTRLLNPAPEEKLGGTDTDTDRPRDPR